MALLLVPDLLAHQAHGKYIPTMGVHANSGQEPNRALCIPMSLRLLYMGGLQWVRCIQPLMSTHQLMQEPMKKSAAAYLLKLAPAAFMGISCARAQASFRELKANG